MKIILEVGAAVHFPNLGTSVFMHKSGMNVLDRCGEQNMGGLVLLNGVALTFKGNVLSIKEPYNWKVFVDISGSVEITTKRITHSVSGVCITRNLISHPERGSCTFLLGDTYNFAINTRAAATITSIALGVRVEAEGGIHLELE